MADVPRAVDLEVRRGVSTVLNTKSGPGFSALLFVRAGFVASVVGLSRALSRSGGDWRDRIDRWKRGRKLKLGRCYELLFGGKATETENLVSLHRPEKSEACLSNG